ncbi:MAG TPA: anion transporter, partial [Desulfobacteraceae bacterium]|nr:anion transporter [Desulfobacteraceae bacterium]
MFFIKSKGFQLVIGLAIGVVVMLLPRPEGTQFKISGDTDQIFFTNIKQDYTLIPQTKDKKASEEYLIEANNPGANEATVNFLEKKAAELQNSKIKIDYVNGLSPRAKRFLAILAVLVFLFVVEPIPLEITAICIGVFLILLKIGDTKEVWAPYMHPVVVFIMCCLIFAISLEKTGITKRLGYFIIKRAGTSVVKFTFIISISLGLASSFMHDAAACAIGIVTMLPLMRAVGIEPNTN